MNPWFKAVGWVLGFFTICILGIALNCWLMIEPHTNIKKFVLAAVVLVFIISFVVFVRYAFFFHE